jgi:hypothetical protein
VQWAGIRERHGWLVWPAAIALVSRAYSLLVIAAAAVLRHAPLFGRNGLTTAWDGQWYLEIARFGYHAQPVQRGGIGGHHDYAFFPLWPTLVRLVALGPGDVARVAVILAPVLSVLAAIVIAAVLARPFGRSTATAGVALLMFSPGAFVLSMAYSEPLFLLLAALALLATAPARRGLLAALAMLTRIAGVAIVAAEGVRFVRSRGRDRTALLAAIGGAVGFATWWLAVALISGSPIGFLRGSPDWATATGIGSVLAVIRSGDPGMLAELGFAALVLVGAVLAMRRDLTLGVYAATAMGLALLPGGLVASMPRYALAAFPAFAGFATVTGRRGSVVLTILFAIGQIGVAWLAFVAARHLAP